MLTWSHYSFRMLLSSKAAETGTAVLAVRRIHEQDLWIVWKRSPDAWICQGFQLPLMWLYHGEGCEWSEEHSSEEHARAWAGVSATSDGDQTVALGPTPSC